MKNKNSKYSIIALAFIYSCSNQPKFNKKVNSPVDSNIEATHAENDSSYKPDFINFKDKFKTNANGRIDSTIRLSLRYMKSLLADEIDTTLSKIITPVDLIVNNSGDYFIVKEHCTAGGDCASYFLLMFNLDGNFIKEERLGDLQAEEMTSVYFEYKKQGDSALIVYKINYNEVADTAIDTVRKIIRLSLE